MNNAIPKELIHELENLDADNQVRVLDYVRSFNTKPDQVTPGSVMKKYVGTIPAKDLKLMELAIDNDSALIDHDSWQ